MYKKAGANAVIKLLLLTAGLFIGFNLQAQKYTFSHYDIENGLIQSQVNKLSQDNAHRLWIGTLGGACRFDGKEFMPYSKENGLVSNFIYTVLCDKKNRVWFGTQKGIACFNDKKLTNYPIPANVKKTWVTSIAEDGAGNIWLIMANSLFMVQGSALKYVSVIDDGAYSVTSIAVNQAGNLYVTLYQKGMFCLKGDGWINVLPLSGQYKDIMIKKVLFDKVDQTKTYLLTYNELLVVSGKSIHPYPNAEFAKANKPLLSLEQDARGHLWVGSTSGVYYLKGQQLIHFNARNGFTDGSISDVYCDRDSNVWFTTWGSGIYKYEGDSYVVFDQSQGLTSYQAVMGIARDKQNHIWLATDGGGIIQYDGKELKSISIPGSTPYTKRMQCIYTDKSGNIWLGTSLGGLWKYDGKKYSMVPGTNERIANAITEDSEGAIWMAAPLGCFYYEDNVLYHLEGVNEFVSSLLPVGKDSMLIGTQYGVKLAVHKKLIPGFKLNDLEPSNIFCMINYHNLVMFGTADWGLFVWDRVKGTLKSYEVKDGLNSNAIYSLIADKNGVIWAGTGRGVNRIIPSKDGTGYTISGSGNSRDLIAEANQNAVLYADDKIWMGTTKGLMVYNTNRPNAGKVKPFILLKSVRLVTQQNKNAADTRSNLLDNAKIPYSQNHITFSFLGIYLRNPDGISYQYQLTGLDDKFCSPVKNTMIDYPSLPPGKYTFQVKAITARGVPSDNIAQFSFEITPPFYQTWFFRIFVLLSFVLIGISLQTYLHKRKLHTVRAIERMKREEKQKIRQQTAEDFHDDLGNKLTRITVLSDILTAKLNNENTEQKKLVGQIKQNAEALYNGTRDILWALDPKSDNLYEILMHITDFGIELFHDTAVDFYFDEIDIAFDKIKLPMEYSRNVTMIYKELLNNVLRHAAASKVNLSFNKINDHEMVITLWDNGKGFDMQTTTMGHGTKNIKNRAGRIGSEIEIWSEKGAGTKVTLKLKLKNGV